MSGYGRYSSIAYKDIRGSGLLIVEKLIAWLTPKELLYRQIWFGFEMQLVNNLLACNGWRTLAGADPEGKVRNIAFSSSQ